MSYKLRFHQLAWVEGKKLDNSLRAPLKIKLLERLENPHVPASVLSGMENCYKIKLKSVGYRLVYRVDEEIVYVTVIAVGKRDKEKVYLAAQTRLEG
jgi:mRNA interferase RelE/StbE